LTVDPPPAAVGQGHVRVAVARGPAFSFNYPENDERLVEAGAELVPFDPATATTLPEGCAGLVAGGGFPEVFAAELAANRPLLADVRARVDGGLVTWAECGGLLWLARALDGHEMASAVPTTAAMGTKLALGYREAAALEDSPLAAAGTGLRGHEFHYSTTEPSGTALELRGRTGIRSEGFASPTLLATYLHLHLGADPAPAERFVGTCVAADATRPRAPAAGDASA
jgi:cobyrinic acid a,c-diamide synthase